jgi:diadenosine tetraphosphate (Ap4A) HIT family hydrolase
MEEVSGVAQALKLAFDARKVNYALFGNLVPHVHWHLIPRLAADPAPHEAVFAVSHEPIRLGRIERADRIARIRGRLGR